MPGRTPNRPRHPTVSERADGIRRDLEQVADETVDLTTADDLRAVIGRVELLIADLGGTANAS
ncbi:MAG: hypothetical protein HQL37_06925 [Alphaproteobacteria bacterium]|nr:hypothetical protein [Alphaproteobacteria bacterium]